MKNASVVCVSLTFSAAMATLPSTSVGQASVWQQVPALGQPFDAAYDILRDRVVLFGGAVRQTWEFDGSRWNLRSPTRSPASGGRLAYDALRRRTILFVGSETWEWDGNNWTQRALAINPPVRAGHAMAYDPVRQRVLMFGGGINRDDTWEWDGNSWTLRNPLFRPSARREHGMAYDLARQRMVLFGGIGSSGALADTWEWNGSDWQQAIALQSPSPRGAHAMTYDPLRQRVLLFGGGQGTNTNTETWEWTGSTWVQLNPAIVPPATFGKAVGDWARSRVVFIGSGTWSWDGTNWNDLVSPEPGVGFHAMVLDSTRGRNVLFGGRAPAHGTWEWNGTRWLKASPASQPQPREYHAMAYDRARQRVVLFGGFDGASNLADTWEYDGSNWSQRFPAVAPSSRAGHGMAYDTARQQTVLFGGLGPAETWEWDGSSWVLRNPAASPAARTSHGLVYHETRQRTILHGGNGTWSTVFADTWEWDGTNWTQVGSGAGRARHAIAFDPGRNTVVVYGGESGGFTFSDTQEWTGTNWVQIVPGPGAGGPGGAMAADPAGRLVRVNVATFLFGDLTSPASTPFGSPCVAGGATPPLLGSNLPRLGNPNLGLDVVNGPGSTACLFALSLASQPVAVGPCTLLLQNPVVFSVAVTNAGGFAVAAPIAIPLDTSYRGINLYAQAFLVDPQGPVFGLSATYGLRKVLGD